MGAKWNHLLWKNRRRASKILSRKVEEASEFYVRSQRDNIQIGGDMPNIPSPGVSTLTEAGESVPVDASPARTMTRRQRRKSKGIFNDPNVGRRVDPNAPPLGVDPKRVDIIEMPIRQARNQRHYASYESVDGNVYTFRTHDARGEADPRRETLSLYLALREVELGGTPGVVFDAFALNIQDVDNKQVYPVVYTPSAEEIIEDAGEEGEEAESPFTLGE